MDTFLTALYVRIDDEQGTGRRMGSPPRLTDSELNCLAADTDFWFDNRWIVDSTPRRVRAFARKGEPLLKSVRQLIESVNDTLKGQLDLERHGVRTFEGVAVRVAQRVLAMAAAIWRNRMTGAPVMRSLVTFDH
ncbi:hypothetical protein ACH4LT_10800 [Streptomyces clavifer]|uniref:hypothetical protein n=1 Tax=Streptomyces clavifer TaxID=68188 RepID=UPI00379DF3E2